MKYFIRIYYLPKKDSNAFAEKELSDMDSIPSKEYIAKQISEFNEANVCVSSETFARLYAKNTVTRVEYVKTIHQ